jgi:nitroreductase
MELMKAMEQRRSIRKYKLKEVEDKKIETILKAAWWAPYGCFRSKIFIIVKDEVLLKKLWLVTPGARYGNAPLAVVICVDKNRLNEKGSVGAEVLRIADPSFAAQNILLAAYDLGLGSCPIASFVKEAVSALLELPNHIEPIYIVSIGYADETPSMRPRPSLEDTVFVNRYGEKYK